MLLGVFPKDTYLTLSGIIGGVASVCGLLSFGIARKFSNEDIETIEAGYMKKIADTAEKLEDQNVEILQKAKAISQTEEELKKLEIQKSEMEFLINKASMGLFLRDQLHRNQQRILELVETNSELHKLLNEIKPLKEKLEKLNQELESDPNVDLLMEVVKSAKFDKETIIELKPNLFGMAIDLKQLARSISKIMTS